MNITAEVITVVVESPPDWTGPIVGILGVVLGALMGLAGIRWQHDAHRAYDIRKQCAELIAIGENLRNSYLQNRNGMVVTAVPGFLDNLAGKADQMDRILRQLELIAPGKTEKLAKAYSRTADHYQELGLRHYKFKNKPDLNELAAASTAWVTARSELVAALRPGPAPKRRFFSSTRNRMTVVWGKIRRTRVTAK